MNIQVTCSESRAMAEYWKQNSSAPQFTEIQMALMVNLTYTNTISALDSSPWYSSFGCFRQLFIFPINVFVSSHGSYHEFEDPVSEYIPNITIAARLQPFHYLYEPTRLRHLLKNSQQLFEPTHQGYSESINWNITTQLEQPGGTLYAMKLKSLTALWTANAASASRACQFYRGIWQ